MNVLHLTTWKERCGIAGYAEDLVRALSRQGIHNQIYPLAMRDRQYMSPRQLKNEIGRFLPHTKTTDVIHIQHEFSFFIGHRRTTTRSIELFNSYLRRLPANKPTVVTFHTPPDFYEPLSNILGRCWGDFSGAMRSLSYRRRWNKVARFFRGRKNAWAIVHTQTGKTLLTESGFSPEHVAVMPLGLPERDSSRLKLDSMSAKEQLGYPKDSILLSLFGFVARYKGPNVAIRAVSQLPENYHLAIVGGAHPRAEGDSTMNEIIRRVEGSDELRRRVRVTGYVKPETLDLYHAATDICLAPYQQVLSSSAALTWALSSGKPVIASRIPSFREIDEAADCLMLFTPGAHHELAWCVKKLAGDPVQQQTLVRNALRFARENSWSAVGAMTAGIYDLLLSSNGRRSIVPERSRSELVHFHETAEPIENAVPKGSTLRFGEMKRASLGANDLWPTAALRSCKLETALTTSS